MEVVRKVNFFEIKVSEDKLSIHSCIERVIKLINHYNDTKNEKRQKPCNSGIVHILEAKADSFYYFGLAKLIREEFPSIVSKKTDDVEILDAEQDADKGIQDETHFVISMNPRYPYPILAIESCMRGAKHTDIEKYLTSMLIHSGAESEFVFDPVFAFNYDDFLKRIDDVASIRMSFNRDNIDKYAQYDKSTGELLRAAAEYGYPEFITLEFSINFQKRKNRHPTSKLNEKVWDFINIFKKNPEAKELIERLDVKATDSNFESKLRLFDLIDSKVASEVPAKRKRPRSQYFDSEDFYEAIRTQIKKDFGA